MKRYGITLALLLLSAGLAIYTHIFEKGGKKEKRGNETTVYSLPRHEIDRVAIHEGKKTLALVRNAQGDWEIEKSSLPADFEKVRALLDVFSSLQAEPLLLETGPAEPPDLSDYGLKSPQKILEIGTTGGLQQRVLFGRKSPVGWNLFVSLENKNGGDDKIYLLPQHKGDGLTTEQAQWKAPPPPETAPAPETAPTR